MIVGDGPERPALEAKAREHSLPVRFLGFRQNDEVARFYAAADFFALPSEQEAWGVVAAEAAASGLPLLLSDQVGAAHDLLEPGRNGFLIRSGDVDAWRSALERATLRPEDLKAMGDRSRAIVSRWTLPELANQVFAAIRTALGDVSGEGGPKANQRDERMVGNAMVGDWSIFRPNRVALAKQSSTENMDLSLSPAAKGTVPVAPSCQSRLTGGKMDRAPAVAGRGQPPP